MKAVIVIGINTSKELLVSHCKDADLLIGCDKGALRLAIEAIPFDLAVGDFDSINDKEFELVSTFAKRIERLNPVKDDTDTAHAIKKCAGYDEIKIIGGIQGKRIEHLFANLIELANDKRICLLDDNSLIKVYEKGKYTFNKGEYTFFSIFALEDALISLDGFAYNLHHYLLKRSDPLGVSNQIQKEKGLMEIESGKVIVIFSKQD